MNAADMVAFIADLRDPEMRKRVNYAGLCGYLWVWDHVETLLGQGFTPDAIEAMAKASALIRCELQLIVEGVRT